MPPKPLHLALSGGGFRATLFHLGVVRALRDFGLLKSVNRLFSVSGGSILAAHLVLNWERYTSPDEDQFREAARELIQFVRSDVRGRLLRRWLVAGWLPSYGRGAQLVRAYDHLYHGALLQHLRAKGRPTIDILATSLISGDVCAFGPDGLLRDCTTEPRPVGLPELSVATAVAASSAFPPLFPPIRLNRRHLGIVGSEMLVDELLTDGGVFDNLGVRAASLANQDSLLITSNAAGAFRLETEQGYDWITARTQRATEILMNRVARLEQEAATDRAVTAVSISISTVLTQEDLERAAQRIVSPVQDASIQKWLKSIRTDLDAFADIEIEALYRHGVEAGTAALGELRSQGQSLVYSPEEWTPTGNTDSLQDNLRKVIRLYKERSKTAERFLQSDASISVDTRTSPNVAKLRAAGRTRLLLWSYRDPFSWVAAVLCGLFVAACVFAAVSLLH